MILIIEIGRSKLRIINRCTKLWNEEILILERCWAQGIWWLSSLIGHLCVVLVKIIQPITTRSDRKSSLVNHSYNWIKSPHKINTTFQSLIMLLTASAYSTLDPSETLLKWWVVWDKFYKTSDYCYFGLVLLHTLIRLFFYRGSKMIVFYLFVFYFSPFLFCSHF